MVFGAGVGPCPNTVHYRSMHISFDFDYTLADSSGGTIACANYALEALRMPTADPEAIRKTIGLSLEKTFKVLSGNAQSDAAAEFKRQFLIRAEQVMLEHIRFYDDSQLVLESLKRDGHYVSIVSTKIKKRIEEALQRDEFSEFVDDIIGGDCVQNNKPDPEGLLMAIQTSGLPSQQTLYVGDSVADGECAHNAGVDFIGLLSGTTSANELNRWNPRAVLDGVGELANLNALITDRHSGG